MMPCWVRVCRSVSVCVAKDVACMCAYLQSSTPSHTAMYICSLCNSDALGLRGNVSVCSERESVSVVI